VFILRAAKILSAIVAFRSAKSTPFCGAKGDNLAAAIKLKASLADQFVELFFVGASPT
jgi:hypothetical protein